MADAPLDVPHAHRHIPSRTARSPELKDEIHMRATEVALNSLAKGAVLGVGVTLLLSRTWPWFGRRPRTFKTIFGLVFPIVGFVVGGEHTALRIERELAYQKSAVKLPGLVSENGMDAEMVEIRERPVTMESLKAYVLENQFKCASLCW